MKTEIWQKRYREDRQGGLISSEGVWNLENKGMSSFLYMLASTSRGNKSTKPVEFIVDTSMIATQ